MTKFDPRGTVVCKKKRVIVLLLPEEEYEAVKDAARQHGVSLRQFTREAVRFAMSHL